FAVVGDPIPKMSDAIIVKKSVNSNCIFTEDDNDAAKLTKLFPIFNPSPVLVTTPTIIPAQAVAAATPNDVRAPDVNAFIIFFGVTRVSLRNKLTIIVVKTPYRAVRSILNPLNSNQTMTKIGISK